jgi:hypothetical protein
MRYNAMSKLCFKPKAMHVAETLAETLKPASSFVVVKSGWMLNLLLLQVTMEGTLGVQSWVC